MGPVDICILARIGSSESLRFKFLQSKDPPIEMVKSRACKELRPRIKFSFTKMFSFQSCLYNFYKSKCESIVISKIATEP